MASVVRTGTCVLGLVLGLTVATASLAAPRIDPDALKRHVAILASDAFEGRAPGAEGERKTLAYVIAQMQAVGLSPGANSGWTQDVPMVEFVPDAGSELRVGGALPTVLKQGTDFLLLAPADLGTEPEMPLHASGKVVFIGRGGYDPAANIDDYKDVDVQGAIVVLLPGGAGEPGREALRRGAAAALLVSPAGDDEWGASAYLAKTRLDVPTPATAPALKGLVRRAAVANLAQRTNLDLGVLETAAQGAGFRPVVLAAQGEFDAGAKVRRYVSHNVIGVLHGAERPREHVVYLAHWDHIGRCPGVTDTICNGAFDNASGVAGMLELARAFAHTPHPARSLMFVATTGEEMGLLGAQWFAGHSPAPLGEVVAAFSVESIAMRGRGADVSVLGESLTDLDAVVGRAATAQGRRLAPNPGVQSFFMRSDHYALAQAGVPAVMATGIFGDNRDAAGLTAETAREFLSKRYHKPTDELDDTMRFDGAAEDMELLYAIGLDLATSSAWPGWTSDGPFRTARSAARMAVAP
jgi:Zn-dependent M28 family amino/carboxypeptidase